MDNNPSNPVFFNTFDPFDNPTPPNKNSNSVGLANNAPIPSGAPVNANVLVPTSSPSNNPYFFPSPLDSPSINPYPLPTRVYSPPITSPTPANTAIAPTPNPLPYSSNSPNSSSSSSVSKSSPLGSPSLSSHANYSQPQQQSPTPQHHVAPPAYSSYSTPFPQPQQPQQQQQQPQQPQQPQQQQPQHVQSPSPLSSSQSLQPSAAQSSPPIHRAPTPSQSSQQIQLPPPQPRAQSPVHHYATPQYPQADSQNIKILEQITGSINAVMNRLDGIDNRISALEIATKEVLNNQRTIATQQKKLQDAVDTSKVAPAPVQPMPAPVPVQHYEEPKKAPVYHPAPIPSSMTPGGPVMMPPPTHSHPHMPALVPVTHISNRGEHVDSYKSQSQSLPKDQYSSDLELAKKLQAEFDAQPSSSTSSSSSSSSNSHSNTNSSYSSSSYASKPLSQPSKSGQQECPICQMRVSIADLEAHVEQHFEDEEAKRVMKPGEKPINKSEAKAGFFAKLFGPKPEEERKAPNTEATTPTSPPPSSSSSPPTSSTPVPYTHTASPATYNQRMGYYANMPSPAAQPMYRGPAYYPGVYPMQNVAAVQQRPQGAPQQYLYYPSLDQAPQ